MALTQTERTTAYRNRKRTCWNCGAQPATVQRLPLGGHPVTLCPDCRAPLERRAAARVPADGNEFGNS